MATAGVPSAVTPLEDYVLVDMQVEPSATSGGIFLPTVFQGEDQRDAFQKQEMRAGVVKAIGGGAPSEAGKPVQTARFEVGQQVMCSPYGGVKLTEEGKTFAESSLWLVKAKDVWSVVV